MGSPKRRQIAALAMAGAAMALGSSTAIAASPSVQTWSGHVERPFIDCPDFGTMGVWEIGHKLTIFYDAAGTPIRDIEQVDFSGRIVNVETGAWVADSGSRIYFDTLAPDGSYLTTYAVEQRKSRYVHNAGRTDFQTGTFSGHDGFGDANIAALCEALGG